MGGGGKGGHAPSPQVLGYQLTLFGPSGADYAPHITSGPPIFLYDAAPLRSKLQNRWEIFPIFVASSQYLNFKRYKNTV